DRTPPAVPPRLPGEPPHLFNHAVRTNPSALPRAWVVPNAAVMPLGKEYEALTGCDFRKTVLLTTSDSLPPNATGRVGSARITDYRPNRVSVQLDGSGGFLVLSDVWFPGWKCRIDGTEVPVYRANHAFRAVGLTPGAREAVFTFEPRSYQ